MHTYRQNGDHWEVGMYLPLNPHAISNNWNPMMNFKTEKSAARMVNYLNGGTGASFEGDIDGFRA